jgi:hypothetical protein
MLPMLVIKIGDSERVAGYEDLKNAQDCISEGVKSGKPIVWATHHAVNFETVYVPVNEDGEVCIVGMSDEAASGVPGVNDHVDGNE